MEHIIVDRIGRQDIDTLLPFAEKIFHDTFFHLNDAAHYNDYVSQAFTVTQFGIEMSNPHSHFFWIKHEGVPAAWLKINEKEAFTESMVEGIEIQRIYVDQAYQGHGYGKAMMDFTATFATQKNQNIIWLGVWEKNEKAIQFYTKNGFEVTSSHAFMFGSERQTDYIMTKKIIG